MRNGLCASGVKRRCRAVVDLACRRFVRYPCDGRALMRRRGLDGGNCRRGRVAYGRRGCGAVARNDGLEFSIFLDAHAGRYQELPLAVFFNVGIRCDDDLVLAVLVDEDIAGLDELRFAVFLDERRRRSRCEGRDAAGVRRKRRGTHGSECILDVTLYSIFYFLRYLELLAYPFVQGLARARADEADGLEPVPLLETLKRAARQ